MVSLQHLFIACVLVSGLTNWVGHRYFSSKPASAGGINDLYSVGHDSGGLRRTEPSKIILSDNSNIPVSKKKSDHHKSVQADAIERVRTDLDRSNSVSATHNKHPPDEGSSFPPIYWINLDESISRKQAMIDHSFKPLGITDTHRVAATNISATLNLWESGRLSFHPEIQLEEIKEEEPGDDDDDSDDNDDEGPEPTWMKHARNVYLYSEAACLLSHLNAIRRAYADGHELALILEDDAMLSPIFRDELMNYISQAPKDWKVLQFATNNPRVIAHGSSLQEPFISWQPYHWSSRAYLVNRNGMQTLLEKVHSISPSGEDVWNIQSPHPYPMVVADEVVFALIGDSYTSSGLWVDAFKFDSTVQLKSSDYTSSVISSRSYSAAGDMAKQVAVKTEPQVFEESLLVLMSMRIANEDDIKTQLQWILQDTHAVCKFHPGRCQWEINVVATTSNLMELFQDVSSSRLPSYVHIHAKVNPDKFNKFVFIRDLVDKFEDFDMLLFKDNDQRISGFPWHTFVKQRGDAIMAGPLRATTSENTVASVGKIKSQFFQFHEAKQWVESSTEWGPKHFASIQPIFVPFLEMYFVLLESKFASEFFRHILAVDGIVKQSSNWGVDSIWCQAAAEWETSRPGCRLVPVVSVHMDSRQIVKDEKHYDTGAEAVKIIQKNPTFAAWMEASAKWRELVGHKRTLEDIEYICPLQGLHCWDENCSGQGPLQMQHKFASWQRSCSWSKLLYFQ